MADKSNPEKISLKDVTNVVTDTAQKGYHLSKVTVKTLRGVKSYIGPKEIKTISGIMNVVAVGANLLGAALLATPLAPAAPFLSTAGTVLSGAATALPVASVAIDKGLDLADKGLEKMSFLDDIKVDKKEVSEARQKVLHTVKKHATQAKKGAPQDKKTFDQIKESVLQVRKEGEEKEKSKQDNTATIENTTPKPGG